MSRLNAFRCFRYFLSFHIFSWFSLIVGCLYASRSIDPFSNLKSLPCGLGKCPQRKTEPFARRRCVNERLWHLVQFLWRRLLTALIPPTYSSGIVFLGQEVHFVITTFIWRNLFRSSAVASRGIFQGVKQCAPISEKATYQLAQSAHFLIVGPYLASNTPVRARETKTSLKFHHSLCVNTIVVGAKLECHVEAFPASTICVVGCEGLDLCTSKFCFGLEAWRGNV